MKKWFYICKLYLSHIIQPGPNEITIYGLDPEVDLDSIRVTGRGSATITDIQTEVVPQREQFKDVFPDDCDEDDDVSAGEDPDDDFGVDRSELTQTEDELKALGDEIAAARNEQSTATTSLEVLDTYGKSIKAGEVEVAKMEDYLKVYQKERERLSELYQKSTATVERIQKETKKLTRKRDRLSTAFAKAKNAAAKSERQEREKRQKLRDLKAKEKTRARNEKLKFWSYQVAQVVLHLDGFSDFTPNSSRRSSVISTAKKPDPENQNLDTVSFSLNYVTTKATWSPRYELNLETPTSSGKIVYRAEYYNYSSETWRDANLILSTSQTSFSGIDEKTPNLQPWNVKLHNDDSSSHRARSASYWQGGLENQTEINARHAQAPRKQMVPMNKSIGAVPWGVMSQQQMPQQQMRHQQMQQQLQSVQLPGDIQQHTDSSNTGPRSGGLFGGGAGFGNQALNVQSQVNSGSAPPPPPAAGGLFGSSAARPTTTGSSLFGGIPPQPQASTSGDGVPIQDYQMQLMLLEQQNKQRLMMARQEDGNGNGFEESGEYGSDGEDMDAATLSASAKELTFQETSRQDYGLTTTYDIPGQRTIRPSSLKRRHVIADLKLSSITFSHVIIPKLRAAAFLKARISNTSTISLLRGKAGLTLDGTFLGTTTIPSCSPDSVFSLSLGVDPGIQVTYAKPTVRRATSGFFNKEDCAIFTRVCRITNTKPTPVSLAILDQVPVSEDERLRVSILEPKGLAKEGDSVKVGAEISTSTVSTTSGVAAAAKGNLGWGRGSVRLGKGGNVTWELKLEKGKAVKLTLEYEARIPSGQKIVGLD